MKIVIDAFQASLNVTGSDRLAQNMLRELQLLDQENEYVVMTNVETNFIQSIVTGKNFKILPIKAKKRLLWLLFSLPLILIRHKADVFISFYNLAGPAVKTCPSVCFILDTIPISQPSLYFGSGSMLKRRLVPFSMKRTIANANAYVAISEFTKQAAVNELGISSNRVRVILLQADPMFFIPSTKEQKSRVQRAYSLPEHYIFSIGASEPRKNVQLLVRAHKQLPMELRQKFPLRIAGARWHSREVKIDNDPYIAMTGFIDDADIPSAYQLADLFVFPSKYEGFGMPVLEAMASGTPVITTTATSIPEVAGEAAILVNPDDANELADAMKTVLENSSKRAHLVEAGAEQVQLFSWAKAAKELLDILVQVGIKK